MANEDALLRENQNFARSLETNNRDFLSFLDTMAKFHKYDVTQQMNLHLHGAQDASAVATREFWETRFGTKLLEGAEAIPAVMKAEDGSDQTVSLYDIKDTAYYQTIESRGFLDEIPAIPWKYEAEIHGTAVMEAFGSTADGTPSEEALSSAIHKAVLQRTLAKRSDYPSLFLAATEYIVRARMGLPANPSVLQSISRDGILMDRFLEEVNAEVKEIMLPVAVAVKEIDDERVEAWEATHHVLEDRTLNEELRGGTATWSARDCAGTGKRGGRCSQRGRWTSI